MYQNFKENIRYAADEAGTGSNNQTENQSTNTSLDDILKDVDLDTLFKNDAVQKKAQSIADARVTQALATAKAKWEQEAQEAQTEAGKLAKMTEAEKAKYQFERDKQAFDAEKAKFRKQQLQVEAAKQMIEAGLPDLSAYITADTAEDTKANITAIASLLGSWKADELKKAMRGNPPKDTNPGADVKTVTAEEFKKMNYSQRLKLYNENPELYKTLTK